MVEEIWDKEPIVRKNRTKYVVGKEDQLMSIRDLSEKKYSLTCLRCGRIKGWIRVAHPDTKNLHIIDFICRECRYTESDKKTDKYVEDKDQSKFGDEGFNWQSD